MKKLIEDYSIGTSSYEWKDFAALKSDKDPLTAEQKPHTDYKDGSKCLIAFIGLQVSSSIFF
jgi:hypothetical protein